MSYFDAMPPLTLDNPHASRIMALAHELDGDDELTAWLLMSVALALEMGDGRELAALVAIWTKQQTSNIPTLILLGGADDGPEPGAPPFAFSVPGSDLVQ